MTALGALWLPILLSAVGVLVVSSLIHMVLPRHRNDYPRVPDEDAVRLLTAGVFGWPWPVVM